MVTTQPSTTVGVEKGEKMMRIFLMISMVCLLAGCSADIPFKIDHRATANSEYKVNDIVCPDFACVYEEDRCYRRFLGIDINGYAIVQDFYASGEKRTSPYQLPMIEVKDRYPKGMNGMYFVWDINGHKTTERYYVDGVQEGNSFFYYSNGQMRSVHRYQNGVYEGDYATWYESGQKMAEGSYKHGAPNGVICVWYENGQIKEQEEYREGERVSFSREWDEDGNLTYEKDYGSLPN